MWSELSTAHAEEPHKKSCQRGQDYDKWVENYGYGLEGINEVRGHLLSMVSVDGFWDDLAENKD